MIEHVYLGGVAAFTAVAMYRREKYGCTFTFDLFSTVLIMLWPLTLVLLVAPALTHWIWKQ